MDSLELSGLDRSFQRPRTPSVTVLTLCYLCQKNGDGVSALHSGRLASGTAAELARELGDHAFARQLGAGDFAHLEGDPASTISIVRHGQLVVEACPVGAWCPATVGVVGAGSLLGEEALAVGASRNSTVRALTPVSLMVAFREELTEVMLARPQARRLFFALQAELYRLRLSEALANTAARVDLRIARWILHCAGVFANGSEGPVTLHLRQELIAGLAGTRRPTANRSLHDFQSAGLIELRRGVIVVPCRDELHEWIVANTPDRRD